MRCRTNVCFLGCLNVTETGKCITKGWICSSNFTRSRTATQAVDWICSVTELEYTELGQPVPALALICQGPVSWRPTTVKWRQFSQSNPQSTIGTRQTEYHEALPSSANVQSHFISSFADDGNASWYWVCRVPMVDWRLDRENCRHLTVVGLHDTGPKCLVGASRAL